MSDEQTVTVTPMPDTRLKFDTAKTWEVDMLAHQLRATLEGNPLRICQRALERVLEDAYEQDTRAPKDAPPQVFALDDAV